MTGFKNYLSDTPNSDDISGRIMSIPMYPQLTDTELEFVINKLNNFSEI